MKILGRKEIESLVEKKSDHCVSIYMPIHRLGDAQDTLRYKNLLGKAERLLVEQGMRPAVAMRLLEPEYQLLKNIEYWRSPGSEGLAAFYSDGQWQRYLLPRRFSESVTVGERFRIKPLIPLVTGDGRYFVLALQKKNTRLFLGSRFSITEIGLPGGTPKSMEEVLRYDDPERQLQYHTGTAGTGGRRQAMYHGQGVGIDEEEENVSRFFKELDKHLYPLFFQQKIPVVLAGSRSLSSLYRKLESSGMLVSAGIDVNPESLSQEELHQRSWRLVAPLFAEEENSARDKFFELHGTGLTLTDIASVVGAAKEGRIETLFLVEDAEVRGTFDPSTNKAEIVSADTPGAVDLCDLAVAWTLANKGNIYLKHEVEMPVNSGVAAVLRYS